MRILILGGTVFLGRAIAAQAHAAGHDVTCAARGTSGTAPTGTTFVELDRDQGLGALDGLSFDAVIDVSRDPGHVRDALAALAGRAGHWTFVSTCSVYSDNATPGQLAATAPLLAPGTEEYGERKVACEQAVLASGIPSLICRAGLIVGPADAVPRFSYWPVRLAQGGEVLAPGHPDRLVQYVEVDDLAAWLLRSVLHGQTGVFDGIGLPRPFGEFLAEVASGVGSTAKLTWVDQEFLLEQGVSPWAGQRSLPLWLPEPEWAGFLSRDTSPARAAGLITRSTSETARTTLDWWRAQDPEPELAAGLTRAEEAELLKLWHAR
ncbi:NAD-dependent epimerase/dehydratase family protein [Longispora albida]|uniref:NAD-dependent epimerase/dehydratase family protein n=1 Tax=Longispora albida TaxID=203523 RepID=UPI00039DD83E|nr:NAD-dependent epimerase/dehydratase family protein [Longispora albida]